MCSFGKQGTFMKKRTLTLVFSWLMFSNAFSQWQPISGSPTPLQEGIRSMVLVDSILIGCTEKSILHSYDNGESWTYISDNPDAKATILTKRNNKLYLVHSSRHTLYVSTNYGLDWNARSLVVDSTCVSYAIGDSVILLQSQSKIIYRSTDDGLTWFKPACIGLHKVFYDLASTKKYFFCRRLSII